MDMCPSYREVSREYTRNNSRGPSTYRGKQRIKGEKRGKYVNKEEGGIVCVAERKAGSQNTLNQLSDGTSFK
jgi:hypothetical protein